VRSTGVPRPLGLTHNHAPHQPALPRQPSISHIDEHREPPLVPEDGDATPCFDFHPHGASYRAAVGWVVRALR